MDIKNVIERNAPSILLGLGIAGFFGAIFYTARISPKAKEKLEELPPEASKKEKALAIAPMYAPVVGLTLASTGAILASNRIMKNRYAALLVLYSFTEQLAEKWKKATGEEVSAKGFKAIKDKVVGSEEDIPDNIIAEAESTNSTIIYDLFSGRWVNSKSVEEVRKVINNLNATMYRDGFVELNDFYYGLGMTPTGYGSQVGWKIDDGPIDIDLTPIIRNDRPYISITFNIEPKY